MYKCCISIFPKSCLQVPCKYTYMHVHLTAIGSDETFSNRSCDVDETASVCDGTRSYYSVSLRGSASGKVLWCTRRSEWNANETAAITRHISRCTERVRFGYDDTCTENSDNAVRHIRLLFYVEMNWKIVVRDRCMHGFLYVFLLANRLANDTANVIYKIVSVPPPWNATITV